MIRGSILALLGLGSFVAVYIAMGPDVPPEPVTESVMLADGVPPTSDGGPQVTTSIKDGSRIGGAAPVTFELRPSTAPDRDASQEPVVIASTIRDVTPPEMTAAPTNTGPLKRIEQPPAEEQARVERLFNPIVIAAGTIKARGRDIRLAGVSAPSFDQRCGEGEAAWPCGRMARAALRRFIRARAIECDVPAGATEIPERADCRVGGEDIAEWLVARGWAKRTGDRYEEQEDTAREAKLGLWSKTRPSTQADFASGG